MGVSEMNSRRHQNETRAKRTMVAIFPARKVTARIAIIAHQLSMRDVRLASVPASPPRLARRRPMRVATARKANRPRKSRASG